MSDRTVNFDKNAPIAGDEYDNIIPLVIPGYEALHQMTLVCLRAKLPNKANLLIIGAGTGMELVKLLRILLFIIYKL